MINTTKAQREASRAQAVTFQPGTYSIPAKADQFPSSNNPALIMCWGTSENGRQPLNVGKIPDQCFDAAGSIKAVKITVTKSGAYTPDLK
jgi:hypothetical protein